MTEIPVQHKEKSGVPWWVWLLAALLVLGLLVWWIAREGDEEAVVAVPAAETVAAVEPVGTVPVADGAITDLAAITGAADLTAMTGREVRLTGVPVESVVGDRGFFIGSGDQRAFVVLNEQRTPNTPIEGRYDVTAGQVVNVNGSIRRVSEIESGGNPIQDLPAGQNAVIYAQSLDIVQRP